jgi:hypothetical protein
MTKVLLYEDDEKHGASIFSPLEVWIKGLTGEIKSTSVREGVLHYLSRETFDWVVIHHHDFKDVDFLRQIYPTQRFAAYSLNAVRTETLPEGTLGCEFRKKLEAHYDFVLNDLGESIKQMLNSN